MTSPCGRRRLHGAPRVLEGVERRPAPGLWARSGRRERARDRGPLGGAVAADAGRSVPAKAGMGKARDGGRGQAGRRGTQPRSAHAPPRQVPGHSRPPGSACTNLAQTLGSRPAPNKAGAAESASHREDESAGGKSPVPPVIQGPIHAAAWVRPAGPRGAHGHLCRSGRLVPVQRASTAKTFAKRCRLVRVSRHTPDSLESGHSRGDVILERTERGRSRTGFARTHHPERPFSKGAAAAMAPCPAALIAPIRRDAVQGSGPAPPGRRRDTAARACEPLPTGIRLVS